MFIKCLQIFEKKKKKYRKDKRFAAVKVYFPHFFPSFSSVCQTVSDGDKNDKDRKIKELCRSKSLIYQVRKSSSPKTGVIPFIS